MNIVPNITPGHSPDPKQRDKSQLKPSKPDADQPDFGISSNVLPAFELNLSDNSSIFPDASSIPVPVAESVINNISIVIPNKEDPQPPENPFSLSQSLTTGEETPEIAKNLPQPSLPIELNELEKRSVLLTRQPPRKK